MFWLRRYNIKYSRHCFIAYPNTSNLVKNTPLCIIFSTLFSVFGYPDETLSLVFDILHPSPPQHGWQGAALHQVSTPWFQTNLTMLDPLGMDVLVTVVPRGFINISSTRTTDFYRRLKHSELNFFTRNTKFPLEGQNSLTAGQFEQSQPFNNKTSGLLGSVKHTSCTTMTRYRPRWTITQFST